MGERPRPDLRGGCAAMRISATTEGRGAAVPPPNNTLLNAQAHPPRVGKPLASFEQAEAANVVMRACEIQSEYIGTATGP